MHMSAYTDTVSSLSADSTAMTSATTYDDDRPGASTGAATSASHAHPSLTVLELVSNSASASALPGSFAFNVSRKGHFVAVYSASNIWLIKTVQLPRLWARTLAVKRKPVAMDVTEDGFLLAVLSRPSQVDLYEIHSEHDGPIRKRRTIMLVHETSSVVISPDARILITGNKFGIEVVAIGADVPETARRTLSGPAGDALEFSDDGRTLLITGYARKSDSSALFVLPGLYDGPLNDEGEPLPQPPETVWTGSMLFPETARIARQATLLPDADTGTCNELFAFNAEEDSWGIYDIACQRFTQRKMFLPDHQRWTRSEFVDDAMPAVSPNADLAAVALRMRGTTNIWIYEVPGWEYKPNEKGKEQPPIQPCFCIPVPSNGTDAKEICVLRWVKISSSVQRLVAVGNSSVAAQEDDVVPGVPLGSKGVIVMLDFDRTRPAGSPAPMPTKTEYDLDPLCPGEPLPEGSIDFEREVELVRTRTVAMRRAQDQANHLRRPSRSGPSPVHRARSISNRLPQRSPSIADDSEATLTLEEAQAVFETPYDNQQPRSQMSLARAATVAAVSPANRRHLRALPFRPLEYRRADGTREIPHESDADNWVPPPPAYTATAEASESVSLSHPVGPPVPALPANPVYANRGLSVSSTNLSSSPPHPQRLERERRPSLLHPLTYPAPQSSNSIRRRSVSSQVPSIHQSPSRPPVSAPHIHAQSYLPPMRRPVPPPRQAVENTIDLRSPHPRQATESTIDYRSPYPRQAAESTIDHRSPYPRQAAESTIDLRSLLRIDPDSGRRGSAPDVHVPPCPATGNRLSMPRFRGLIAPADMGMSGTVGLGECRNREKAGKKKRTGCAVM